MKTKMTENQKEVLKEELNNSYEIGKIKPFASDNELTHFYFGCSTNPNKPIIHKVTIKL